MGMAEPRRVAFISLSPVRRREADYPGADREPEHPREPPRLEPARAEQPAPREAAPRADAQPPPREKPLPQREVSRAEPPMSLQREPPRPEPPPPPPPLPQLHLPPPPPRESASRAEPPQRPPRETVRLELVLKDPTDESCVEFSYPELLLCGEQRVQKILPHPPDPGSLRTRPPLPVVRTCRRPLRASWVAWEGGLQGCRAAGRGGRAGGRVLGAASPPPRSPGSATAPTWLRRPPPHPPPPSCARSGGRPEPVFLCAFRDLRIDSFLLPTLNWGRGGVLCKLRGWLFLAELQQSFQ